MVSESFSSHSFSPGIPVWRDTTIRASRTGYISNLMGAPSVFHRDIAFVNTRPGTDTRLFLDPCLIEQGQTAFCQEATQTLLSFFDQLYALYRNNASDEEKAELFHHSHEINDSRLGYGNGKNGKAKTPEGMLATFSGLTVLFQSGIPLDKPCDLPLFIEGFAEDCMSDLMTNILYKHLMDFTVQQCQLYGCQTHTCPPSRFFWNRDSLRWEPYQGECLLVSGKPYLLIPKEIVRTRFYFTASQYFSRIILEHIQQETAWTSQDGRTVKTPKKMLRDRYQGRFGLRDAITRMTAQEPLYLSDYHLQLAAWYSGEGMTDTELDQLLRI